MLPFVFILMTKKARYVMKWDRVRGRRRKGLEVFTFMCFVWINPFSFRTHTPQAVQCWAYYYYYYQLQPRRLLVLTHRQTFLGLRPDRPWSFWRDACSSVAARCLPQAERGTAWWGPEEGEVDLNDLKDWQRINAVFNSTSWQRWDDVYLVIF